MTDKPIKRFITEERIKELAQRPFYLLEPERLDSLRNRKCTLCGADISGEWRDELSYKEYTISGTCQNCQDKLFGG